MLGQNGRRVVWWLVASLVVLGAAVCPAQQTSPSAPPGQVDQAEKGKATVQTETKAAEGSEETVSLKSVALLRKQVEANDGLADDVKKKILALCAQAEAHLKNARTFRTQAQRCRQETTTLAQRVKELTEQIKKLQHTQPQPVEDAPLPKLEQRLTELELELNDKKKQLAQIEAEVAGRAQRRKEIRDQLDQLPGQLAEVEKQLKAPVPKDVPPLQAQAVRLELLARRALLQSRIDALKAQLARYDAEDSADAPRLQRDLLKLQVALIQKQQQALAARVRAKRDEQARQAVETARIEALTALPALKPYADENSKLAEAAHQVTGLLDAVDADLAKVEKQREAVKAMFDKAKAMVESVGLTEPVGFMLRKNRTALPNVSKYKRRVRERRQIIEEAQFKLFDYDQERAALADVDSEVKSLLERLAANVTPETREEVRQAARELVERKRQYLDQLIRNYNAYLDALFELDAAERRLIQETEAFANYIDEQVLWIRSSKPLPAAVRLTRKSLWLLHPDGWKRTLTALVEDLQRCPWWYAAALMVSLLLVRMRRRMKAELTELSQQVRQRSWCEFQPTLQAAGVTVVMSVWAPLLLWFLSWRLAAAGEDDPFVRAVAVGLARTATYLFPLELLRQICSKDGLASAHFDWSERAVEVLRRNLRWLVPVSVPLVFLSATLKEGMSEPGADWLARICFIAATVVLSVFLWRVLKPSSGVFQELIAYHPGGWVDRLKYLWFAVASLGPLLLAVLAFFGYDYTARVLSVRLLATLWLVLGLILLRAFLSRWLLLRRRRLAIERLRQRRAAEAAARQSDSDASPGLSDLPISQLQQETDLSSLSEQTQRLVNSALLICGLLGVWMIWIDVLPALHFLDRWTVWTTTTQVTEKSTSSPNGYVTHTVVKEITVTNLALCFLIAFATAVAAKNVPGLMEILLLQRLPFDASTRYAITSLTQYGIVILGVMLAFGAIGIGWSKVQWIATALTFGLAFGLQEIFANFVAGLILLFEQPIRVGDVVTVDDVTGVVSRIRIRATTITNWDRKEFIIPNKDFITGRLLNWTLSDKINRVVIEVGVAYGSDTELVQRLLLKVAEEHPLVLNEPAPSAVFDGFGDSTLHFTLRCYLPNLDNRLTVIHELHAAIDREFRQAGIEIAFPQLDLHIRSTPPDWPKTDTTRPASDVS